MVKVVIVDDENIVRLGLRSLIDWEAHGFSIAGLFSNGRDALEFCASNAVDIILTDIKMPEIDGVELIKRVKKCWPGIEIIVLSNYDDFPFVKESFKEGIYDYVLKQFIEPETLLKMLLAIKGRLSNRASLESEEIPAANLREEREDYLRRLVNEPVLSEKDLQAAMSRLGIHFTQGSLYMVLVIKLYKLENGSVEFYKGYSPSAVNVLNVINEVISRYCSFEAFVSEQNLFTCILTFSEGLDLSALLKKADDLVKDLFERLINYFNLKSYIGISSRGKSLITLKTLYAEALHALDLSFFRPDDIFLEACGLRHSPDETASFSNFRKEISYLLRYNNVSTIYNSLNELFTAVRVKSNISPNAIRQIATGILEEIDSFMLQEFSLHLADILEKPDNASVDYIYGISNVFILHNYLSSLIKKVSDYINANYKGYEIIARAKAYASRHYMENMSLEKLSKTLNINSAYFCHLFKEKTGENFTHYISKLRIEAAIELIRKTTLSTEEIAEKVGYSNPNYFIKVFKKITNKTLSEFKEDAKKLEYDS